MGFMGAGKTTVGRLLAPMLGWRFLDTDAMLVERHGASIASLFERHGEPRFREWEAETAASALAENHAVIALGGGAIEHPGTRALLFGNPETLTVYLEVSLPVSLARCGAEAGFATRPVLADAGRLKERYAKRLPFYSQARLLLAAGASEPPTLACSVRQALEALRDIQGQSTMSL